MCPKWGAKKLEEKKRFREKKNYYKNEKSLWKRRCMYFIYPKKMTLFLKDNEMLEEREFLKEIESGLNENERG